MKSSWVRVDLYLMPGVLVSRREFEQRDTDPGKTDVEIEAEIGVMLP